MRCLLLPNISGRVVPIRQSPALAHHPSVQVITPGAADGDDAAVAVDVVLVASDGLLPDLVGQGERSLLAAAVGLLVGLAGLVRLRRVDAEEADALAVDLDGAAVDHRGLAGKVGGRSERDWLQQREHGKCENDHPTHDPNRLAHQHSQNEIDSLPTRYATARARLDSEHRFAENAWSIDLLGGRRADRPDRYLARGPERRHAGARAKHLCAFQSPPGTL